MDSFSETNCSNFFKIVYIKSLFNLSIWILDELVDELITLLLDASAYITFSVLKGSKKKSKNKIFYFILTGLADGDIPLASKVLQPCLRDHPKVSCEIECFIKYFTKFSAYRKI